MFGSILASGFGTLGYLMVAILVIVIFLVSRIRIVPQAKVYIVERLGAFHGEWSTGPHFLVPFLDKVARIVSIKEQVVDFKPQPVITKDNVTMQIDTVVFSRSRMQSSTPMASSILWQPLKI